MKKNIFLGSFLRGLIKFLILIFLTISTSLIAKASSTTVVEWNFDDQNKIADQGISVNLNKTINRELEYSGSFLYYAGDLGTGTGDYAISSINWNNGSSNKFWQVEFSSIGFQNLKLSSKQRSSPTGPRDFKVQYSLDTGINWTDIPGSSFFLTSDTWNTSSISNINLPWECDNQSLVLVRWVMTSNISAKESENVASTGTDRIDDITVVGEAIPAEVCGDGVCNGSENSSNCPTDCPPVCGNGTIETGEECDKNTESCTTGGYTGTRSCDSSCQWKACDVDERCGDGIKNGLEACDDGINNGQYGYCKADCTGSGFYCGDGIISDPPEVCDGNSQSCTTEDNYSGLQQCRIDCGGWENCETAEKCGDGIKNGNEQCDDGNVINGDGCSDNCLLELTPIYGSISGFVYYDKNHNNQWDGLKKAEFKLNGFKIFIDENNNSKYDSGEKYQLTHGRKNCFPEGEYLFEKLLPGAYKICQVLLTGWSSSLADNSKCQEVIVLSGENKTGINFGRYFSFQFHH